MKNLKELKNLLKNVSNQKINRKKERKIKVL